MLWISCRSSSQDDDHITIDTGLAVQLCLWTLNPAIAFRDVDARTHSVILTSGTLAPIGSFASEARPARET